MQFNLVCNFFFNRFNHFPFVPVFICSKKIKIPVIFSKVHDLTIVSQLFFCQLWVILYTVIRDLTLCTLTWPVFLYCCSENFFNTSDCGDNLIVINIDWFWSMVINSMIVKVRMITNSILHYHPKQHFKKISFLFLSTRWGRR